MSPLKKESGSNWRSPLVDPVQNGGLSKLDNWLTLENWFKKYPQFLDEVTFSDTPEKKSFYDRYISRRNSFYFHFYKSYQVGSNLLNTLYILTFMMLNLSNMIKCLLLLAREKISGTWPM